MYFHEIQKACLTLNLQEFNYIHNHSIVREETILTFQTTCSCATLRPY
jgi:hypothetical protein